MYPNCAVCFCPTPKNTVIVDVPPAAGRWGRGCSSEQKGGETRLKGELPPTRRKARECKQVRRRGVPPNLEHLTAAVLTQVEFVELYVHDTLLQLQVLD